MRDLSAILRGELEALEAELAVDPRSRMAAKIRELLAMYEDLPHTSDSGPAGSTPHNLATAPAVIREGRKVNRIRWAIQIFLRPRGSATIAHSRLVEMAKTNRRPNASSAWLQVQTAPMGDASPCGNVPSTLSAPTSTLASVLAPTTS
jgi:hypothetical protein